jgi:uncharacterized protein
MNKWAKYTPEKAKKLYNEVLQNVEIWDCHTHIGKDKDKHAVTPKKLIKQMIDANVDKAIVFPLNDPRDSMSFHVPNDEIFDAYRKYPKIFIPFFRINPHFDWKAEFKLRVQQGFRGVKLHPRSQRFKLSYNKLHEVLKWSEKHHLLVLVHVGFGLQEVADDLVTILKKFPKLKFIIGHSGFVDLPNVIKKVSHFENVLFDTSVVRVFDLFDLMSKVDSCKIAFGSDVPYYDMDFSLQSVVDTALYLKKSPLEIKQMLGTNLKKWCVA